MPIFKELHRRQVKIRINTRDPRSHDPLNEKPSRKSATYPQERSDNNLHLRRPTPLEIGCHRRLHSLGRQPQHSFSCQEQRSYATN